jgi:hypothetical protein
MIMRLILASTILIALSATDSAREASVRAAPAEHAPMATEGRYRIYQSPITTRDTFLLDTATGAVWQLRQYTFLQGDPLAWDPLPRLDSEAARASFIQRFRRKAQQQSSRTGPAQAAAAAYWPRLSSPLRGCADGCPAEPSGAGPTPVT